MANYDPHSRRWDKEVKSLMRKFRRIEKETQIFNGSPSFRQGIILSGEKMIKNGKLPEFANEYHEKALACEEEAAGFCRSCEDCGVSWLVFRGISDFGDQSKRKKCQPWAALTAASAASLFLRTEFRLPSEEINF
ncbi:MAG: hypothetical protein HY730_08390 [Candidatus Tectomicrobia bacterium]|uniref:Nucleoside phosphorylase domain-containing protein n=1 Tax=Tectimicrobiota bacterium TaxID=2528274 RepID=A0A933GM04_UNCTE|nr:hypothetical protein [Candidatus Tectomicrobia bacterium]